MMEDLSYNLFARLLDGTTRNLRVSSPSVLISDIKNRIREISGVPISNQRLVAGGRQLEDDFVLQTYEDSIDFPTLHLVLRLPGGKGGFGSLLRGAATKAGQKKTSNFDACRDMSGRRLRHVNAEKKLEEWKADAEQRRLEKVAEDYIKKNTKAAKKSGGSGGTEKYVEKYRQDSAKCMEKVEKSVRESLLNSKRKIAGDETSKLDSKRLKIWIGKRTMGDSESEDSEMDDSDREDEENVKSVVINKAIDVSSDSVNGDEFKEGPSSDGNSNEVKEIVSLIQSEYGSSDSDHLPDQNQSVHEQVLSKSQDQIVHDEVTVVSGDTNVMTTMNFETNKMEIEKVDNDGSSPLALKDDTLNVKPLNLKEFNSASELEAFGLDRLKTELQANGLKCGGTLKERASRLFLLKTTPLEKLPKKLLAKN